MKIMLILPPQWAPFSPPLGLPVLTAYLKKNGYEVVQKDASVDFYNYILTKEFIGKSKEIVDSFLARCISLGADNDPGILPEESRTKFNVMNNILKDLSPWWPTLESNTERSIKILKNPGMFYQPLLLAEAIYHLKYALLTCGLAYFPSDILLNYYHNNNYKLTIDSIDQATKDDTGNIFLHYYKQGLLEEIGKVNPGLVGISINCNTQLVGGLTLARQIKEMYPHIHVNIGGNAFTRLLDVVEKRPEIFDKFVDSIIHGEGENSILALAQAVENKTDLSEVPGLAFKKDGKAVITAIKPPESLDKLPPPDFTGIDLTQYLSGDPIFPVQSSRGCYWRKCSFCDHDYGTKYSIKTPTRMVEEIKELVDKFGAKYFYFVDESISPNYMKNLATKIIENNLDIAWYTCARAEEGFTDEICELAAKSGLKLVLWGLESGSERVLELINKGITKESYIKALTNTNKNGIWNHAFVFFGFPSENIFEAMETINMLVDNKNIINSYGMGPFALGKYSPIANNPDKYYINYIAPSDEELSTATEGFTTTEGMTREEVQNFVIYNTEYCAEQYGYPLWLSLGGYKDHIFLYLDKYGPKVLSYSPDETVQMFGSF